MFNHARTLLLNIVSPAALQPGEELIPAGFRPLPLPASLHSVRRVLFGSNPDRAMLSYRSRQLLTLIHACQELAGFVTDLDPRLTYDFLDVPFVFNKMFLPVAIPTLSGSGAMTEIFLLGAADPPDRSGQVLQVWDAKLLSGTEAQVALRGQPPVIEPYTVTGGLSSPIPLPESGISFQVRDSVFPLGDGPSWRIESRSRPEAELGTLLASLEHLGEETTADLFGIGSQAGSQEPLQTFRKLFTDHFDLAHRLGGAVLALIYQTEAIRVRT